MAKVKITAAQIIALRSATMRDNGSYELTTAKGQTVNALTRMGIVVSGTRFLTVQGVSVMHSVRDVSVIASKGHTTYVSDSPESLELFTLPARESDTVEIQGDYVEPATMTDIDGSVIPYDAFRSQEIQEAHRRIADGGCVGLCAVGTGCAHCDTQYGPAASQTDAESVDDIQEETSMELQMIPAGPVMVPVIPVQLGKDGMPDMGIYGATLEESGVSVGVVSKRSKTAHFIVEGTNSFCGKTVQYVNGVSRDAAIISGTNICGICRTAQRVQWEHYNAARVEMLAAMTEERHTDAESVSKAVEGDTVEPFVFVPGIHALDMGDKGYNRFAGIGESSAVAGSLYTFGLSVAISAHPGMNGTGKTNIPCEFGDVITVRTSIGDKRFVIEDNRYSATGPRKGDPILTPYTTDDARCVRCETHGDNSMPGKNIGGEWVCGYCVENTESDESAREFPCFKRMGVVTHKGECSETRNENGPVCSLESDHTGNRDCALCVGADTRFMTDAEKRASFACVEKAQEKQDAAFQEMVNAPESDWMYRANGLDDDSDAGFVETESTDDYAIVSRLSTGAGFHTVTDAPVSTGTTHHTMDTHGGQWERFEHVLSVGDIVRSTETGRTLYEVYALIPGLPVVYVDPCDGREPFPMGATSLYAL